VKDLFQITNSGRAHLWLLAFAATRSLLDDFWLPAYVTWTMRILSFFNTLVYVYTLYLQIPFVAVFILQKVFSRKTDLHAILRESVLVWAVYPAVTIISLVAHSPATRTIEWFRYIPTFLVENNFLPLGMIVVIPVIFIAYAVIIHRHSEAGWAEILGAVLVSLVIVYLLYYQYTLALYYFADRSYGRFFSFGLASLCYLVAPLLLARHFKQAFGDGPIKFSNLLVICLLICVALMVIGLTLQRV
jgi:hypothetical protein